MLRHRLVDNTPIQLMKHTTAVWTKTEIKNGVKDTIVCGDLNATWTSNKAEGQFVLEHWSGDFRVQNRIRKLADKKDLFIYTRGGDGQR